MKIFDRLQSWIRVMEDIEDPVGSELRRLREQIRALVTPQSALSIDGKRVER